jgi:hypothetical protein
MVGRGEVAHRCAVKQYIDAGGSLQTAAEYLNQQLQQQDQALQDQLNQGDQTAIQDAIQLNNLIQQRVQMMKDEAATEFGIINAGSLERQVSSAVVVGNQLQKQREQYDLQLESLNDQVTLETEKVNAESQIFDINKSLAQLQADSNALTIASLNEQLAKYQDMAALIKATSGLQFTPGSLSTSATWTPPIPGEPTVAGPVVGTINITVNGDVTSENATTLANEIAKSVRSGSTQF